MPQLESHYQGPFDVANAVIPQPSSFANLVPKVFPHFSPDPWGPDSPVPGSLTINSVDPTWVSQFITGKASISMNTPWPASIPISTSKRICQEQSVSGSSLSHSQHSSSRKFFLSLLCLIGENPKVTGPWDLLVFWTFKYSQMHQCPLQSTCRLVPSNGFSILPS